MTGPEHYREAERLLDGPEWYDDDEAWHRDRADNLAAAQVHATLALAAAQPKSITDDDIMRCDHGAIICGLCGYGVPAGGAR